MTFKVASVVVALVLVKFYMVGSTSSPEPQNTPVEGEQNVMSVVVRSTNYRYDAPPSIGPQTYVNIMCDAGPACENAEDMYNVLVEAGIDPVVEAAQANHETKLGTLGIGRSQYKNMHGVQCHTNDGRIGDSKVSWGNGCAAIYASYADSLVTWASLINREYIAVGLNTPELVIPKYAPVSDGNDPPSYIAAMKRDIDQWRAQDALQPVEAPASDIRAALVAEALALQGIPYIRGGRSANGGDCSGTMQYIFKTVASIDIGGTTFSQQDNPNLLSINEPALRPGDLWYGQYSDDQHTGMVADVDNDGRWDLINNGGLSHNMHVDYDFLSNPYFSEHTMGYRNAIND